MNFNFGLSRKFVGSFKGRNVEKKNIAESQSCKWGPEQGQSHSGNRKENTDPSCVLEPESKELPLGSMFSQDTDQKSNSLKSLGMLIEPIDSWVTSWVCWITIFGFHIFLKLPKCLRPKWELLFSLSSGCQWKGADD